MDEIVHLNKTKVDSDLKVLLLIIPIIIFVLIAIFLLLGGPKPEITATIATP